MRWMEEQREKRIQAIQARRVVGKLFGNLTPSSLFTNSLFKASIYLEELQQLPIESKSGAFWNDNLNIGSYFGKYLMFGTAFLMSLVLFCMVHMAYMWA